MLFLACARQKSFTRQLGAVFRVHTLAKYDWTCLSTRYVLCFDSCQFQRPRSPVCLPTRPSLRFCYFWPTLQRTAKFKDAAAIIDFGLSGEQEGNAVVDVLCGVVSPSRKLPHTLPNVWNEVQMTQRQYPGIPPSNPTAPTNCQFKPTNASNPPPCTPTQAYYDEKLLVGYRWWVAATLPCTASTCMS